jgi:hypothetical protein
MKKFPLWALVLASGLSAPVTSAETATTTVSSQLVVPGGAAGTAAVASGPQLLSWSQMKEYSKRTGWDASVHYDGGTHVATFTIYGFSECMKPDKLRENPAGRYLERPANSAVFESSGFTACMDERKTHTCASSLQEALTAGSNKSMCEKREVKMNLTGSPKGMVLVATIENGRWTYEHNLRTPLKEGDPTYWEHKSDADYRAEAAQRAIQGIGKCYRDAAFPMRAPEWLAQIGAASPDKLRPQGEFKSASEALSKNFGLRIKDAKTYEDANALLQPSIDLVGINPTKETCVAVANEYFVERGPKLAGAKSAELVKDMKRFSEETGCGLTGRFAYNSFAALADNAAFSSTKDCEELLEAMKDGVTDYKITGSLKAYTQAQMFRVKAACRLAEAAEKPETELRYPGFGQRAKLEADCAPNSAARAAILNAGQKQGMSDWNRLAQMQYAASRNPALIENMIQLDQKARENAEGYQGALEIFNRTCTDFLAVSKEFPQGRFVAVARKSLEADAAVAAKGDAAPKKLQDLLNAASLPAAEKSDVTKEAPALVNPKASPSRGERYIDFNGNWSLVSGGNA